jgi:hypothetical protein
MFVGLTSGITGRRLRHRRYDETPAARAPVHALVGRRSQNPIHLDAVEPRAILTIKYGCPCTSSHARCPVTAARRTARRSQASRWSHRTPCRCSLRIPSTRLLQQCAARSVGTTLAAIGAVALRVAARRDGDSRDSWFKVDRNRQVIRLTRQLRLSVIASAAPNAHV